MNQNIAYQTAKHHYPFVLSFFICTLTVGVFLLTSNQFLHWFIIPVTLSGILVGIDAVQWLRGRLNIFDPVGIIGLLSLHFFFLAPLLHISWDSWLYGMPSQDWRPWLGGMAILNFLGLLVYRLSRSFRGKTTKFQLRKTVWRIDQRSFPFVLCFALTICAILQILVYQQYGGLIGYITAFADPNLKGEVGVGQGWIFMFSDSFPILAMMGFAEQARKHKKLRSWPVLIIVLVLFILLKVFFGGLRGSRSNIIWALFWAVGIIHLWIQKVTKTQIYIFMVVVVIFMYSYGFFKAGGLNGLQIALQGQEARQEYAVKNHRTLDVLILQDLGRSDLQAFMLYRLMDPDSDYEYAWGRTYLASVSILIPKPLRPWSEKLPNKSKEGTELQFGRNSYVPDVKVSSKVYGLAGETMLNFGPFVVPFAFIMLGISVRRVRYWVLTWEASDSRLLLLPMLINFCFAIIVSDSDNLLFFIVKNGCIPFAVILMSSNKKLSIKEGDYDRLYRMPSV